MPKNIMQSYDSMSPKPKNVSATQMLNTTAREAHATGTNALKRHTGKHANFGTPGLKGHA